MGDQVGLVHKESEFGTLWFVDVWLEFEFRICWFVFLGL